MPVKQITLIMLLLCAIAILPAALMWEDAVAIRQGVNIEWFRTGTETNDGGAIYVWSDTKLGERDLWAQKVDASGNMVWPEPLLVDGKPDRQEDPVITKSSDGNYIIAWIDFFDDLDGNVYAQKINNQGQLLWQEGGVPVCTLPGMQLGLNMEPDLAGGAFIIWGDSRNPSKDLYAQHISSSGAPLWTVNGIPVANGPGDEIQNTMLPDGQGGMMLAYTHTYVGDANIYAKHYDADGNMTWDAPLGLAIATGNQTGVRMAAIGNGEFIFTWTDQRNNDPDIYAQKVNIAGQMLWSDPFIVYSDQSASIPAPQQNPRIQATSDNAAVIVWEDFRLDSQNADLFAQKLAADGTKLWGESGIAVSTADFAQIGQRMASDGNGGVYIVWDDLRNGNSPNDDVYAQHLNAAGEALWTAGGKAICTMPNEQNGGLVKVSGSNVFINWMDNRNGSIGIYYQVLNPSGTTMLADNGVQVFWGLSGDTPKGEYKIVARSNDTVILWQDTRFANEGYRIYYQILTQDGQTLLETNGRTVTLDGVGSQYNPQAVVTEDNHVAIVWTDDRTGASNIYAQLLSPSGERLWGDNGIKVTDDDPLSQVDPRISYFNNSFYIGWSSWDLVGTRFRYHVYGQRIENDQKQWGPSGKMISVLTGAALQEETKLTQIVDDTYVWHRVNPTTNKQTVWAKRVNSDGDAATGWTAEGLMLTDISTMTVQLSPVAQRTPQGIYVTWRDMRNGMLQYFSQHVSRDGQRLWNPAGVSLANRGNEQEFASVSVVHNGIVTTWCENVNGMHDIIAKKYDFAGTDLWGELGYFVIEKDSTQTNPTTVGFPGAGTMIAWAEFMAEDSDIYYNYMNATGELVLGTFGQVLSNAGKAQYEPLAVELDNNAIVVWADGRSSGKTEILGLYAMRVNNESVSNNDAVAPQVFRPTLKQNYPNPFNPNTSIALSMPKQDNIRLNIYNAKGQLVKTLFDGNLERGDHSFNWDGKDANGATVASGVYFYSAINAKGTQSRKMVLMK
jgi:hypothetical protein